MRLFRSRPNHDQAETGNERNRAQNWGERERVLGLVGDLNRTEIDVLLRVGERDSAGGVSDDAKNDKQYSDDGGCLHEVATFPRSIKHNPRCDAGCACVDVPATALLQALVDTPNPE